VSRLDLDTWINDPPSESEDETISKSTRYENHHQQQQQQSLFSGDQTESYYHSSHLDTHGHDSGNKSSSKTYVEPSAEELEQKREVRKQAEKLNPFYLKESSKSKPVQHVSMNIVIFSTEINSIESFISCTHHDQLTSSI
jgi:hypothetical protein